jgi:hypothetical protein
MKIFLIVVLTFISIAAFSQHTIFPKKGIAISCFIENVTVDTIFYYPEWASKQLNSMALSQVKHYTYNIDDSAQLLPPADSTELTDIYEDLKRADSLLNLATVENEWYYVGLAGKSIKSSLRWKLATYGLSVISAMLAPMSISNGDLTLVYFFAGAAFTGNIISIIQLNKSGNMLEQASKKNMEKTDRFK